MGRDGCIFLCVMMEKGKVGDESGECEGKGEMVESGLKRVGESGEREEV